MPLQSSSQLHWYSFPFHFVPGLWQSDLSNLALFSHVSKSSVDHLLLTIIESWSTFRTLWLPVEAEVGDFIRMSIPSNAWFDTFRDRGPVLFDGINRTPAIEDVRNVLIYISFSTLFVAFLIIFPGIRKEVSHVNVKSSVSLLCYCLLCFTSCWKNTPHSSWVTKEFQFLRVIQNLVDNISLLDRKQNRIHLQSPLNAVDAELRSREWSILWTSCPSLCSFCSSSRKQREGQWWRWLHSLAPNVAKSMQVTLTVSAVSFLIPYYYYYPKM